MPMSTGEQTAAAAADNHDNVELACSSGGENDGKKTSPIDFSGPPPPKSMQEHTKHGYMFTVTVGLLMAFSAGYSNAVCLGGFLNVGADSATQSVAGVTGVYTNSAIFLVEPDYEQMSFMFGTIFSVMFGAFLAAIMNPYPIAFEISPRYGPTFLLGSLFMVVGATEAVHNDRREFFFTAIANGLMNGVSSMYSANLLRTSHLTGTTTDIGLFLGMALRGNRTNNWKLYILIGLAVFFWTGSVCGYVASQMKRQYSLIFNACFLFLLSVSVTIRTCILYHGCTKWTDALDHLDVVPKNQEADGTENDDRLSEDELEKIFDEIAALSEDGEVDQHLLLAYLASQDLKVKKNRKGLVGLLHHAFVTRGDGDWKLDKEEWKDLVHQSIIHQSMMNSAMLNQSMMTTHMTKESIRKSSKNLYSSIKNIDGASTSAVAGPEALRQLSIMQLGASLR
ncbi:hypothetical protein QTG54_010233 [Skeletonema marinoi]|uniref:DUF1275 domain-containing protein n=1 Tax=Skeletonema marinoi TaxID=267567 RepID=A0AAD8Y3Q5_9STRA|nr:hypothetical protein QTG54_010233 [Skeletonema marinoi]